VVQAVEDAPPGAAPVDDTGRPGGRRAVRLLRAVWPPTLVLAAVFALWWVATASHWVKDYLVPAPPAVFDTMRNEWPELMHHSWITLYETLLGFVFAVVLGLGTAVLISYSRAVDRAVYPLVLIAQVIPKVAIAPLLVVWFGTDLRPKVVLATLIAFFPVVVTGVAGLRSTDPELVDLSATMGGSRWQLFWKIRMPNSLPQLLSGIKVAVTLAVVGAVVGEWVEASAGLGYLVLLAHGQLDSPLLYACLILMSAIGIALFILVDVAEAVLIPWHASRRATAPLTTA